MEQSVFFYILCHIVGLGNRSRLKLLAQHYVGDDVEKIIRLGEVTYRYQDQVRQQLTTCFNHLTEWEQRSREESFILLTDASYPDILASIYDPPAVLFYEGKLDLLKENSLGVIGSRKPIYYSYQMLNYFIPRLVPHFVIVSGLARGIDAYAHLKTLEANGRAVAVIGSGLDVYYPIENRALQQKLMAEQLVISEYPQGTVPHPYHFPARNRIIAGLSSGVCVMQAGAHSGTFITANQALEEGRAVYAVPGNALAREFEGCHQLIQSGAKLVYQPEHIIEEKWLYQYRR